MFDLLKIKGFISGYMTMKHIREPVVAGQFYEGNADQLKKQIEWCFLHLLGPGEIPAGEPTNMRTIIAAQVPHAGYVYSGPAAAHVYFAIYHDGKPETFIILGPNHTGLGLPVAVYTKGAWKTPLGSVEIDEEFAIEISKKEGLSEDRLAHTGEHSIEVQLPFLQYLYGSDFKIVPITMMDQTYETAIKVAEAIINVKEEIGRDIIILASSDMSHYEPHDNAARKDNEALKYIEEMNIEEFYNYVLRTNLSMCGYGPVMVAMHVAKHYGSTGLVLKYYTSGDITGEKNWVVGYAAVLFGKGLIKPKREKKAIEEAIYPV